MGLIWNRMQMRK